MASLARRLGSLLLFALLAGLSGCGEQAEIVDLGLVGEVEDMGGAVAPHSSGPKQVVVPQALPGKFTHATVEVRLPGMVKGAELELPIDGEPHHSDFGTLTLRDYLPTFRMRGEVITSDGLEEKNPAVWAEWQRDGELLFSGWLFRNYPDMSKVKRPQHQLHLLSAR